MLSGKMGRLLALAAVTASLLHFSTAVPPSRFNKPIKEHELEKEWQDPESDEWHEDTYEWKRKEAQKRAKPLDLASLTAGGGLGAGAKDMLLQHEANSGNMQMAFITLRSGVASNDREIGEIAGKWQALLQTNGVKLSFHPIGGDDILVTEDGGRILEARDFILNQPEVAKFRWKDTDFTPTPTPAPGSAAAAAAARDAASWKKGKGKKSSSGSSSKAKAKAKAKEEAEKKRKAEEAAAKAAKEAAEKAAKKEARAARKAAKAAKKAEKERKAKEAAEAEGPAGALPPPPGTAEAEAAGAAKTEL